MKTILVADEDIRIVNLVRLTFTEHMGYNVVAVSNGADAILKAGEIKPDVVLVDFSLSNQNGYSVSREIKNDPLLKDVYVILLRSGSVPYDDKKVFGARADDIITKPFEPEELTKKVLGHFDKKGPGQTSSSSKKEKAKNKDTSSDEAAGLKVPESKKGYAKLPAAIFYPLVNYFKNFYLSSKAYRENLKGFFKFSLVRSFKKFSCRIGVYIGGVSQTVGDYAEQFQAATGKLKVKMFSSVQSINGRNLRGNLRSFYGPLNTYYKQFKLAIGSLRERWTRYAALHVKSFKYSSPHFDRKYSYVSALGIGALLLVAITVMLADKGGESVSSSSWGLNSISTPPELKTSPKIVVAHNTAPDDVSNKEPKGKVASLVPDTNIPKEEFLEVEVKQRKEQSSSPESTEKVKETRADKYVVRRGDTLWEIANKFNVSLEALRVVNGIRGDKLYVGKVLTIPQGVIRKEVTRWDIIETTTHSGGIKIIDWSFYMPWSGVAVIHHVFIENTSDKSYKDIKVKIIYNSSSDDNRTKRGEIITTLPIFVPRNSKNIYLEDGISIRGDFNTNGMNVTKGDIEILEASALGYTRSYSSR